MKKILLDLSVPETREKTQEYIAEKMQFPEYYGKNLDALYDMLTSIGEPTAVGIFLPVTDMIDLDIDLMIYFDRIGEVFRDAETDNPNLAVIFGDLADNPGYEDRFDELYEDYPEAEEESGEDPDLPGDSDVIMLDIGKWKQ